MTESLPTEARIAQKARLKKMAEKGEKPERRKQIVEDGNDDCGMTCQDLVLMFTYSDPTVHDIRTIT